MRVGSVLAVPAVAIGASLVTAAPASADCVSSAGTSICSQGSVRGADTGEGPGTNAGPAYPYPCEYDWTCGSGIEISLGPILPRRWN